MSFWTVCMTGLITSMAIPAMSINPYRQTRTFDELRKLSDGSNHPE